MNKLQLTIVMLGFLQFIFVAYFITVLVFLYFLQYENTITPRDLWVDFNGPFLR